MWGNKNASQCLRTVLRLGMKLRDPVSRGQRQLVGELDGEAGSEGDHQLVGLHTAACRLTQQSQGVSSENPITGTHLRLLSLNVPVKGD